MKWNQLLNETETDENNKGNNAEKLAMITSY